MRFIGRLLVAGVLLSSVTAQAGRGGSTGRILQATASGSVDAIVAEVERAEKLACLGCIDAVMKLIDHDSAKVRDVAGWWLGKRGVRSEVISLAQARFAGQDPVAARNAAVRPAAPAPTTATRSLESGEPAPFIPTFILPMP